MINTVFRVGLLVGALTVCSSRHASAAEPGPYLDLGAGVNIVNDVDLGGALEGLTAEFDPGFRFSVAGGYHFTPMISAELETGYMFNDLDQLSLSGASVGVDDTVLSHVPFLANVVFRFENSSPFIPFIGAGAGGVASFLDIDAFGADDSDGDVVFAWQAQAGLHYRINDNMSAGITYKYLGADSPEFDIEGASVETDILHNHSILASFNWSF